MLVWEINRAIEFDTVMEIRVMVHLKNVLYTHK